MTIRPWGEFNMITNGKHQIGPTFGALIFFKEPRGDEFVTCLTVALLFFGFSLGVIWKR